MAHSYMSMIVWNIHAMNTHGIANATKSRLIHKFLCTHKTIFHIKHVDANIIIIITVITINRVIIIIAIFMWNLRLKFASQ